MGLPADGFGVTNSSRLIRSPRQLPLSPTALFTSTRPSTLSAIDASTGVRLWNNGLPGESSSATVTVANGVVYDVAEPDIGDPSLNGRLMMFDAGTGRLLEKLRDPDAQDFGFQAVVANGTVYVTAVDHIDAFALP